MPATCDGCGTAFNLEHCQKGGLVTHEVQDALGDLASIVFKNVIKEPMVKDPVALLDVRVVDTDAPSHIHRNTDAVFSLAGEEEKRKYNSSAEARRASFTPFVVSTDGMLGREANFLL